MQLKTSWFNRTLFKKNLFRYWPIWVCYTLGWSLAIPINLLLNYGAQGMGRDIIEFADSAILESISGTMFTVLPTAILAAMAVFSYLYTGRSAGMLHALPIRREGLFLTNYLSGLSFLAIPTVLVFLFTLLAEATMGYMNVGALCMWLVVHLLTILFFYSFAVFCAMLTGNLVALPAFYAIFNGLAIAIYGLIHTLFQQFLYGYSGARSNIIPFIMWLTPSAQMLSGYQVVDHWSEDGTVLLSTTFQGLFPALVYGAIGIVLTVLALLLYQRRHLETAGDVISVFWVRPIFRYVVGFCAALAGGTFFYFIFQYTFYGPLSLLFWLLVWGAVGYFVAEMLLQKSFRVFRKWKGCAILLVTLGLMVGGICLDPFGFTKWVPDSNQVESVSFGYLDAAPYDGGGNNLTLKNPESIAQVLDIMEALIAQKEEILALTTDPSYYKRVNLMDEETSRYMISTMNNFAIELQMADGRSVRRSYPYLVTTELLEDPTSHASLITALFNGPEARSMIYSFPDQSKYRLIAADLTVYNTEEETRADVSIPAEDIAGLYEAVRADIDAGRLGIRFLMSDQAQQETCYDQRLTFGYYDPDHAKNSETMQARSSDRSNRSVDITLQSTATETLAELHRLGILDETHVLLTESEYEFLYRRN